MELAKFGAQVAEDVVARVAVVLRRLFHRPF